MIAIPASLPEYRREKSECDKALSQARAPGSLTVSQARAFYGAQSLGLRARIDCWCFLWDIWQQTWRPALAKLPEIPIGDAIWEESDFDPAGSLDEGRFATAHRLPNGEALFAGVLFQKDFDLRLGMSIWAPSKRSFENVTANYRPGDGWKGSTKEETADLGPVYYTPSGVVPSASAVRTEQLAKLALAATAAVLQGLKTKAAAMKARHAVARTVAKPKRTIRR